MNRALPPSARATFARCRSLTLGARAHIALRWFSCPFPAVAAAVPRHGRILDLGCGHGAFSLFLALDAPARVVHGVDVDVDKIDAARRAAEGLEERVSFEAVPMSWRPAPAAGDGGWDGIVVVDVLYLLGAEGALALVDAAAAALAPGGTLVVKEIDTTPRWKYRLAVGQELAATRVAKVTEGDHVDFVDPAQLASSMRAAGLDVARRRIDRGYPHPHLLLVGTRPGGR